MSFKNSTGCIGQSLIVVDFLLHLTRVGTRSTAKKRSTGDRQLRAHIGDGLNAERSCTLQRSSSA